jgi:hypothetical protein
VLCIFKLRILQELWDLHAAELSNECRSYLVGESTRTEANIMRSIDKREDMLPEIDIIEEDLLSLCAYVDALDANYIRRLGGDPGCICHVPGDLHEGDS